jgi:uncharacterized membrane protein YqjE
MLGKRKQKFPDIENDIARNRISGIEIIEEKGLSTKHKYIIGVLSLAVIVLATVIILVTFVFKKPGPFTSDNTSVKAVGSLYRVLLPSHWIRLTISSSEKPLRATKADTWQTRLQSLQM